MTNGPLRAPAARRVLAVAAAVAASCLALAVEGAPAAPTPPPSGTAKSTAPLRAPGSTAHGAASTVAGPAAVARKPAAGRLDVQAALQIVRQARDFEDLGAYSRALVQWRRLRALAPLDGDLELAIALDEARGGQLDSAAVRLAGRVLSAAALDTMPVARYRNYTVEREGVYLNGTFNGWHWYVWRARAEVAAARERWDEATPAARRCVAARPESAAEWLLLSVCAGRAGLADEARGAAIQAVTLDPALPEAQYLAGLWAWRDGRRAEAQASFRQAVAADSTLQMAAMAMVRSRLPGTTPDSLPTGFLSGEREVGMLTSTVGPKLEEFVQDEEGVAVIHRENPVLPESLKVKMNGQKVPVWLFVNDKGRVVFKDLPRYAGGGYPPPVIADLLKHLSAWRFEPAKSHGEPHASWVALEYEFPH